MRIAPATVLAGILLLGSSASATTIAYTATDLPDAVPGEDLWEYAYTVSGRTFAAGEGFSVFFDYTQYTLLESPPPAVSADWDIISLQPDVLLPDDGFYDALALVSAPSLTTAFTVSFVWLGTGTPGAQPFDIYNPAFQTIESGVTVPEPGTGLLLAAGLFMVWITSFERRSRHGRMNV